MYELGRSVEEKMKKRFAAKLLIGVMCLMLVVAVSGCKGKKQTPINPELSTDNTTKSSGDGLKDVNQDELIFTKLKELQVIYFDYNSFALRPDALKALGDNAEKMKGILKLGTKVVIQIEGHCDERGTQEYNLALGEKRALAVREHLTKLSISGDNLVTISYGKERPVADGHNEDAWKQNRRAEFNKGTAK